MKHFRIANSYTETWKEIALSNLDASLDDESLNVGHINIRENSISRPNLKIRIRTIKVATHNFHDPIHHSLPKRMLEIAIVYIFQSSHILKLVNQHLDLLDKLSLKTNRIRSAFSAPAKFMLKLVKKVGMRNMIHRMLYGKKDTSINTILDVFNVSRSLKKDAKILIWMDSDLVIITVKASVRISSITKSKLLSFINRTKVNEYNSKSIESSLANGCALRGLRNRVGPNSIQSA